MELPAKETQNSWSAVYGIPIAIFLLIVLCIGIPRLGMIYSWNDSPAIFGTEKILAEENIDPVDFWKAKLTDVWRESSSGGFRPLSTLLSDTEMVFFVFLMDVPAVPIMISMIVLGLAGALLYLLVMELFSDRRVAISSVFLFIFSLSVITGSWIVIASKQPIAYLFLIFSMLCYVKFVKTGKPLWIILYCVSGFVGPLYREFVGIIPLVVILNEALSKGKSKPIYIASFFLFLHAMFPSFIVKLVAYGEFAIEPVFKQGLLEAQMKPLMEPLNKNYLLKVYYVMPPRLILLFPPVLIVMVWAAILMRLTNLRRTLACDRRVQGMAFAIFAVFIILLFAPSSDLVWKPDFSTLGNAIQTLLKILPVLVVLAMSFASFSFGTLLPIWFLISWLPFLKIFTEEVHLAYALIPMSIIYSLWLRELVRMIKSKLNYQHARVALTAFALVATVGYLDHALNLYSAYFTFKGINNGILKISAWLSDNVGDNSVIVANFIHAEDISFYSGGKVEAYWTMDSGISDPGRSVSTPPRLVELLEKDYAQKEIYFLAGERPFLRGKAVAQMHPYTRIFPGTLAIVAQFQTEITYPFVDPLKNFVPMKFISFAGPPDLVDDFIVKNHIFLRECLVRYDLMRIVDIDVRRLQKFREIQTTKFRTPEERDFVMSLSKTMKPLILTPKR